MYDDDDDDHNDDNDDLFKNKERKIKNKRGKREINKGGG
jgi:hypothetical protein